MKISAILAGLALGATLGVGVATAEHGEGNCTDPEVRVRPEQGNRPAVGEEPKDAPPRRTGPLEDDQGIGVVDAEKPNRPNPGRDQLGNEPGTGTGQLRDSAGDAPADNQGR